MIDSPDPEILDYLNEFTRVNRISEQIITVEEEKAQRGQVVTYLESILLGEIGGILKKLVTPFTNILPRIVKLDQ